jgi:hypothetical protein
LFCKDCYGVLKCGVFSLIVCDRHREGNGGSSRSGRWGGDGIGGGSTLCGWFFLKAGQTDLREVAGVAVVVADWRAGVLLQAVFVRLRAVTTTAILHPFAPLLDDILIGQSLEVRINVVGIDVHCVGIAETRGRARS